VEKDPIARCNITGLAQFIWTNQSGINICPGFGLWKWEIGNSCLTGVHEPGRRGAAQESKYVHDERGDTSYNSVPGGEYIFFFCRRAFGPLLIIIYLLFNPRSCGTISKGFAAFQSTSEAVRPQTARRVLTSSPNLAGNWAKKIHLANRDASQRIMMRALIKEKKEVHFFR
jgi:hypothetical protein